MHNLWITAVDGLWITFQEGIIISNLAAVAVTLALKAVNMMVVSSQDCASERIRKALVRRLNDAWVLNSVGVECAAGRDRFVADVALHTRNFIFGRIQVGRPRPGDGEKAAKRYGIEQRYCYTMADVDACVKWAVDLQERYVRCHARAAVA